MVQDWILAGQDVMAVQGLTMPHDTMAKYLAIFSFDYPTIKIYFDVQAYLSLCNRTMFWLRNFPRYDNHASIADVVAAGGERNQLVTIFGLDTRIVKRQV